MMEAKGPAHSTHVRSLRPSKFERLEYVGTLFPASAIFAGFGTLPTKKGLKKGT